MSARPASAAGSVSDAGADTSSAVTSGNPRRCATTTRKPLPSVATSGAGNDETAAARPAAAARRTAARARCARQRAAASNPCSADHHFAPRLRGHVLRVLDRHLLQRPARTCAARAARRPAVTAMQIVELAVGVARVAVIRDRLAQRLAFAERRLPRIERLREELRLDLGELARPGRACARDARFPRAAP